MSELSDVRSARAPFKARARHVSHAAGSGCMIQFKDGPGVHALSGRAPRLEVVVRVT